MRITLLERMYLRVSTGGLQSLEKLDVDWNKLAKESNRLNSVATLGLSESQERNRAEDDGPGMEASNLGLKEFPHRLSILCKSEGLGITERRLCVVVVAVEPFDHLHGWDIDTLSLATTGQSEVLVKDVQFLGSIALRDSLVWKKLAREEKKQCNCSQTHVKQLDVVKDLVVEGEVVGGDDVDTGILLDLPVSKTETLSLSEEGLLGDLVGPVSFSGLLEVSQDSHTRETQDCGLNHDDGWIERN
jgi:hypothetical protein